MSSLMSKGIKVFPFQGWRTSWHKLKRSSAGDVEVHYTLLSYPYHDYPSSIVIDRNALLIRIRIILHLFSLVGTLSSSSSSSYYTLLILVMTAYPSLVLTCRNTLLLFLLLWLILHTPYPYHDNVSLICSHL